MSAETRERRKGRKLHEPQYAATHPPHDLRVEKATWQSEEGREVELGASATTWKRGARNGTPHL
jgi:hypothetical protein